MKYDFINEEKVDFNLIDKNLIDVYKFNQLFHYKNLIKYLDKWIKHRSKFDKLVQIYRPRKELINRAYYKCWEIITKYNITVNNMNNMNICNICEGPGGFIQGIYDYRNKYHNKSDSFLGITLLSEDKNFKWANKYKYFQNINFKTYTDNKQNLEICDKNNNNNNLLNPIVINNFIKSLNKKKFDLVTGDGGMFVKEDNQNFKEIYHSNLFFSEIYITLKILKKGGHFILKMYDISTKISLDFLQLLYDCFESINIFKPETSRIFNSERYIICTSFKGIEEQKLDYLICLIEECWYNKKKILYQLYEKDYKYDINLINIIQKTNKYILNKQILNYSLLCKNINNERFL